METVQTSIVVAITGGIGTGKSTVGRHYQRLGNIVFFMDEVAKELMANDPEIKKDLIIEFSSEVFDSSGRVNSHFLSEIVFNSEEKLNALNKIVHPKTIDFMISEIERLEKAGEKLIFVESALIFESGLDEGFDYIITVTATEENILERVIKRTGMDYSQVIKRIQNQMSNEEKTKLSDFVIENNKSEEDLLNAADIVLNIIRMSAA